MLNRLKRSYRLIVNWFFVGLAVIFFVGNAYVMWKMTAAQSKLDKLAAQLDYRPDQYANDSIIRFDPNPIAFSETRLLKRLFSTPLSSLEVQTRLKEAKYNLKPSINNRSTLIINSNAIVGGISAKELKSQGTLPDISRHCWWIGKGEEACIHETIILNRTIEIRGQKFTGNVIELRITGIRTQLWTRPGFVLWKRMQNYGA